MSLLTARTHVPPQIRHATSTTVTTLATFSTLPISELVLADPVAPSIPVLESVDLESAVGAVSDRANCIFSHDHNYFEESVHVA